MIEATAPGGLRERKKQQTRSRIIDVALDLCDTQGFERTTVDQIADAADVSPRTVNRYFETKEDVVLAPIEDFLAASVELLKAQPKTGNELLALRDSFVALLHRIMTTDEPITFERFQQMQRIIRDAPSVSARSHEFADKKLNAMTAALAERLGVERDDLSLRLILGTWRAIIQVAMEDWDRKVIDAAPADAAACCMHSVKSAFDIFQTTCVPIRPE
jgi:AcrR family transcriptional regulator